MLFDVEEAQELYYAQSRYNYKIRSFNIIEHFFQHDCNYIIFESKQYNIKSKNIDDVDESSDSNLYSSNDNSTCKTLNKRYCFSNTLSTFAINLEAKYNL